MSDALPIVVGWDGSPGARAALTWAAKEAGRAGLPLQIVLAVHSPEPALGIFPTPMLTTFSQEELTKIFAPALELVQESAPGVVAQTSSIEGHPVSTFVELSRQASMVVLGSRRHSQFVSALLGSTSLAVASHSDCPVIVIRGEFDCAAKAPVVVGTDGSQTSGVAVRFAAQYAHSVGAPLLAVCSAPEPVQLVAADIVITPDYAQELRGEAEKFVHDSVADLGRQFPGLQVSTQICEKPASVALSEAGQDAQLLVVGSHGRGGFTGMLLGSVSRSVLFHAPCPVAVVRARKSD